MPAPNPLRQLTRAEMSQIDAAVARMKRVVKESKRLHAEKQREAGHGKQEARQAA